MHSKNPILKIARENLMSSFFISKFNLKSTKQSKSFENETEIEITENRCEETRGVRKLGEKLKIRGFMFLQNQF